MTGEAELDARVDARLAVAEVPVAVELEREVVTVAGADAKARALAAAVDVQPEHLVGEQRHVLAEHVAELGQVIGDHVLFGLAMIDRQRGPAALEQIGIVEVREQPRRDASLAAVTSASRTRCVVGVGRGARREQRGDREPPRPMKRWSPGVRSGL